MASITKPFTVSDGNLATVDTDFETMGLAEQPRVASNAAAPHSSVISTGGARIKTSVTSFSTDYQECRMELVTHVDFEGVCPGVMGSTDGSGYWVAIRANTSVRIRKYSAGTPSNLTGDLTPASAFVAGDTLSIRYQKDTPSAGTCTLTVYRNGVSFGSVTDSSQLTAGQPWAASINANAGTSAARWDNFYAEDNVTGSTTITPAVGTLTINGRTATVNSFSAVAIKEVFINEAGSPVANRTGMSLLVWYAGNPTGAPDLSYSALTTDANGTASWSLAPGSLAFNQTIFYVATDGGASLSMYTCARMIPTYTL